MSVKISQLPSASAVTSDDLIPIVDSGSLTTQKATAAQLLSFITSSITELPNFITSSTTTIGPAEDGTYTDGLFNTFNTGTLIGTAIDKINEVLKGLAPPAAPDLNNLESIVNGTSMKLSFGASVPTASYTDVTASLAGLVNVDVGEQFSITPGSGGNSIRLGVFANTTAITLRLNNNTVTNGSPIVNYPADAFNVADTGTGSYILEVNGTQLVPSGSTVDTGSYNLNNFNLSVANSGTFSSTGLPFDIFRHRTGTVTIPTSEWRNGHNYAKVTHVSSLGTHVTNFIDWVYDPQAASTGPAYLISTPTADSFSVSGQKSLSGIKYYTSLTYNFSCSIGNYYRNCYPVAADGGVTFSGLSSGLTATPFASTPVPANTAVSLQRSSAHSIGTIRLLGQSLSSTINVANGLGKTANATLTTDTVLLDKINTANTNTVENFCLEDFRLSSGSFDTQVSVTSAPAFPSGSSLAGTEMAVYNGAVRYPTQTLNGGNIEGSSVVQKIASQPDYSSATGNRLYFRKFVNGVSVLATFNLLITGANTNFVASGGSLTGNNVKISIKVPGTTGWRDIKTPAPPATDPVTKFQDGLGCLTSTTPANPDLTSESTSTFGINLLGDGIPSSQVYVIRIEASPNWTGYISKLQIS